MWNYTIHVYACVCTCVCIIYPNISLFVDIRWVSGGGRLFAFLTTGHATINIHLYVVSFKNILLAGFQIWVNDVRSWPLKNAVIFPYIKN